jgi:hypothetical protein
MQNDTVNHTDTEFQYSNSPNNMQNKDFNQLLITIIKQYAVSHYRTDQPECNPYHYICIFYVLLLQISYII